MAGAKRKLHIESDMAGAEHKICTESERAAVNRRIYTESDIRDLHKELDEVLCPICMEHPHNAVLLLCSSHEKGCRTYICDTSSRHSNCLDQFKKLNGNPKKSPTLPSATQTFHRNSPTLHTVIRTLPTYNPTLPSAIWTFPTNNPTLPSVIRTFPINSYTVHNVIRTFPISFTSNIIDTNTRWRADSIEATAVSSQSRHLQTQGETGNSESEPESKLSLKCPMCRGAVQGWEVVEEARKYLNLKKRDCSKESCTFIGNYPELRLHARKVHPTSRPSETDPSREVAWQHIERQSANRDIISALQPDSVVVGDFVIENGNMFSGEMESGTDEDNEPGWSMLWIPILD